MKVAIKHYLSLPDLLTYGNLFFGLLAGFLSLQGEFTQAAFMLLISVALDGLDGKAAGLLNKKSDFGRELDSLADTVSFGIMPVLFGLSYHLRTFGPPTLWLLIFMAFFVMCGVTRLARYNVMHEPGVFRGVPITVNGALFPVLFFTGFMSLLPVAYVLSGILMVSRIKLRRIF
ncbi:MAG: CDP-diacylglycerol--serine O-phosphatidyltransferase [Nanoarchaeota archaeon]|nr:CDP-diacylglycerol--serine O-phosphatidyltransferase [Nanoarchaeota archaeon]